MMRCKTVIPTISVAQTVLPAEAEPGEEAVLCRSEAQPLQDRVGCVIY